MKQKIARLISNILNPFLISFICIIALVWHAAGSTSIALKWTVVALLLSVIPVFSFIVFQVKRKKLEGIFPENQAQRKIIYIVAGVLAAVGCAVMWFFGAPHLLTVCFIAGLVAVVVFMGINYYWKISLHTAFVSSAATVMTFVFGSVAAWLFVLLPLVAWSRLELKMHTPAQVIAGALLSASIVTGIFWGFGVA